MLIAITFFILFVLLAALCAISIFKNFLSQYKMSRSGALTLLVLLLAIIALFYSLSGLLGTAFYQDNLIKLGAPELLKPEELESLKEVVKTTPKELIVQLLIGIAFFLGHFSLIKIIQRKLNNQISKGTVK